MDRQELCCVQWRTSRYCDGGSCVEVAQSPHGLVAVRDSANPNGPALLFTPAEWRKFTNQAERNGTDPKRLRINHVVTAPSCYI
jgi:hypothetical protein